MYVPAGNAAPDPDGTNSVGNPNVGPATLLLAMYPEVPIAVAVVPDDPRGLVTDGLAVDFNKLNTCTPLAMRSAVLVISTNVKSSFSDVSARYFARIAPR